MNDSHSDPNEKQQAERPTSEAWEDRLSERALRERLGGESPPDLTQRILAAASAEGAEKMAENSRPVPPPVAEKPYQNIVHRVGWLVATAAVLLIATLLFWPASMMETAATRSARPDIAASSAGAGKPATEPAQNSSDPSVLTPMGASGMLPPEDASSPNTSTDYVMRVQEGGDAASVERFDSSDLSSLIVEERAISEPAEPAVPILPKATTLNSPSGQPTSQSNSRSGGEGRLEGYPGRMSEGGSPAPATQSHGFVPGASQLSRQQAARPVEPDAHFRRASRGGRIELHIADGTVELGADLEEVSADDFVSKVEEDPFGDYSEEFRRGNLGRGQLAQRRRKLRGGDRYARLPENRFKTTKGESAVSTFSIDVDTASYTNARQYLLQSSILPPPSSIRIEEWINYFGYAYEGPDADAQAPFASHIEVARCPWNQEHLLARIALKGREMETDRRPASNLVFLVDVSGSMNDSNKLPLVVDGLRQLTQELGENDTISIVVYAGSSGLALRPTNGLDKKRILGALERLSAGGSTAGGAGIKRAYKLAQNNFISGGVNRVILCTDGDFNVGVSDTAALQRLAEQKAAEANVFLTVLGFGRGNLNDEMMEAISNKGNGNYHYIDNAREARKVLVEEMSGTLVTIAKDVKIQVEFNPALVAAHRLIGYENRALKREDFDDDTKDAGEIGAGHTVTALYELVPQGSLNGSRKPAAPLKYQPMPEDEGADLAQDLTGEFFTLRLRYKQPEGDESTKLEFVAKREEAQLDSSTSDFDFAAAVASLGMLLRQSEYAGNATFESVLELAASGRRDDPHGYRAEFVDMVRKAQELSGR